MTDNNTLKVIDYETGEIEKPKEMIEVSNVRTAIEQAGRSLADSLKVNSMAKAAEAFYAAQGMEENAQKAKGVSLWAQRKAGEFLKEMPKNTGAQGLIQEHLTGGFTAKPPVQETPTLADLDIDKNESFRWQLLAEIPEETFQDYIDGKLANGYELTAGGLVKIGKSLRTAEERAEAAKKGAKVKPSEKWHIYHADMQTWKAPRRYDFIITDPPYPKEYLYLYEVLAQRAKEWLEPGGLLIAMCGQSYLDEIYAMMSKHIEYYWTAAYLTPGQPTPIRQVNVNTTWKPLLIFSNGRYKGKIFGDVFKSDGNDKDFHKWGQSESGMFDIVSKICLPGQYILDPFCGAGTTLIAALKHGCLSDGVDCEIENVNISKGRLGNGQ